AFVDSALDPSAPPKSWEELLGAVRRVSTTGRTGLDMMQWTQERVFVLYLYQNSGKMWTDNFTEVLFAERNGIESLAFLAGLYQATFPSEADAESRLLKHRSFPE